MRQLGIWIFNWVNRHPVRSFFLYFGFILLLPVLFTISATSKRFDFTNTGQIGDTIGGITAPFIGLISAYLVYISFRQQYIANKLILETRHEDGITQNINLLTARIEKAISDFKFGTVDGIKGIFHCCMASRREMDVQNERIQHGNRLDWEALHRHFNSIEMKSLLQIVRYFDYTINYLHSANIDNSLKNFNVEYLSMLFKESVHDNVLLMEEENEQIKTHMGYAPSIFNWVKITTNQVQHRIDNMNSK